MATSVVALVAGGDGATAGRLGLAMFSLQASIGALNDWWDAAIDRGAKPRKPLASGVLPNGAAVAVGLGCGLVGLALVVPSGPVLVALAIVGLAIGYVYDLWLSRSILSWLPWAVGIPLLPVFAWYGATGELPRAFLLLVPLATAAGTALAIGNALADLELDEDAAVRTVAVALGRARAWRLAAGLHGIVILAALASLIVPVPLGRTSAASPAPGLTGVIGGGALVLLGLMLGRRSSASSREAAWEVQALGVGIVAIGWLVGIGTV